MVKIKFKISKNYSLIIFLIHIEANYCNYYLKIAAII